jgi:hypothetical protein
LRMSRRNKNRVQPLRLWARLEAVEMPKKGLPRCKECRWSKWEVLTMTHSSMKLRCENCGAVTVSRSMFARKYLTPPKEGT